jgi:hypothetical protein
MERAELEASTPVHFHEAPSSLFPPMFYNADIAHISPPFELLRYQHRTQRLCRKNEMLAMGWIRRRKPHIDIRTHAGRESV